LIVHKNTLKIGSLGRLQTLSYTPPIEFAKLHELALPYRELSLLKQNHLTAFVLIAGLYSIHLNSARNYLALTIATILDCDLVAGRFPFVS